MSSKQGPASCGGPHYFLTTQPLTYLMYNSMALGAVTQLGSLHHGPAFLFLTIYLWILFPLSVAWQVLLELCPDALAPSLEIPCIFCFCFPRSHLNTLQTVSLGRPEPAGSRAQQVQNFLCPRATQRVSSGLPLGAALARAEAKTSLTACPSFPDLHPQLPALPPPRSYLSHITCTRNLTLGLLLRTNLRR